MFKSLFIKIIGPLLSLFFFTLSIYVLHHELTLHPLHEILRAFHELPVNQVLLAALLTIISYLIMSGYDFLALHFIRHPLSHPKIILASFVGYAFSNNIGLSMIAGASVRYRLYSAWGLSGIEITKIVIFCTLTLWLGFFMLGGMVFSFDPMALPSLLRLPLRSARPLGILMLLVVTLYFFLSVVRKKPIKIRNWEFLQFSPKVFLTQILIASADWLIAAAVFYSLMPKTAQLSFTLCMGVYLLGQLAGLISQVPGGLGIFETIVFLQLSPIAPGAEIMGGLLAFRVIYYLLPFGMAIGLMAFQELAIKQRWSQQIALLFGKWVTAVLPPILSFASFIAGAILLFSGATPAIDRRLIWLKENLPLPFLEISHFVGSIVGVSLLILARGLQRRMNFAYHTTAVLLVIGIIVSLIKGLDYEEALILTIVLMALFVGRKEFYRKASFWNQEFSFSWISTIGMVIISTVGLGLFAYKHVEYSNQMWWQFTFAGDAPRFLRASIGVVVFVLVVGIVRILRTKSPVMPQPDNSDINTVTDIVQKSPNPVSNLAFLGDKSFLFNSERNTFIMFGVEGRSWVSMGDPIGPESEWSELIWQFRELSDRYAGWTVFYQIPSTSLQHYIELGLTVTKLGEEARVFLPRFSLEGSHRKELRYIHRKIEKQDYHFEIISGEDVKSILPALRIVSEAWMAEKNAKEKSFSLGRFAEDYLSKFSIAIVRKGKEIVSFANLWQSANQEEITVDLMRYHPEIAPNGLMDYMFVEIILWGNQVKFQWFNLGMAPLTGMEDHALAPLWNRLASFVADHGGHFYNFQGLRQYKDKFDPVWKPVYMVSPGGLALPQIMINLVSLISGNLKGALIR